MAKIVIFYFIKTLKNGNFINFFAVHRLKTKRDDFTHPEQHLIN